MAYIISLQTYCGCAIDNVCKQIDIQHGDVLKLCLGKACQVAYGYFIAYVVLRHKTASQAYRVDALNHGLELVPSSLLASKDHVDLRSRTNFEVV